MKLPVHGEEDGAPDRAADVEGFDVEAAAEAATAGGAEDGESDGESAEVETVEDVETEPVDGGDEALAMLFVVAAVGWVVSQTDVSLEDVVGRLRGGSGSTDPFGR